MKKALPFLVIVAVLVAAADCSKRAVVNAPDFSNKTVEARIVFTSPKTPEEVILLGTNHHLTMTSIEHSIVLGEEHATAFLPIMPNETASQLRTRWDASYVDFLISGAAMSSRDAASTLDAKSPAQGYLNSWFAAAALAPRFLQATAVTVQGTNEAIESFVNSAGVVQSVQVQEQSEDSRPAHLIASAGTATAAVDPGTWVPRAGRIITQPSPYYSGQREAWNYFIWGNKSGFAPGYGYEHDFYLDNQDGVLYLDGYTYLPDGFPRYEYAVTNLPAAYLDSRSGDDSWLRLYTLGCANGSAIVPERQYYTYWRTRNGNASTDRAGLSAQLTYHKCGNDYTWCMYSVPGTPIYQLISDWRVPVPSNYPWAR